MKITLCGSMQFEKEMKRIASSLQTLGYETATPNSVEGHAYGEGKDLDEIAHLKQGFIRDHFAKIDTSEAIFVVNCDKNGIAGYIGGNTLMEMTYAFAQGLDIYTLNDLPIDSPYSSELAALMPVVLHGDIGVLDERIKAMPVVYMSTQSPVKHTAIGRGLRKAGLSVRTEGVKVASGVNEQPQTIDETYDGAMNRHAELKRHFSDATKVDYYATIESGLHPVHRDHNVFGVSVIILEKVGEAARVGIDMDIEYPKSLTAKIPSIYPDMGVLVQQEFGSTLKDPYPYLTGNKLTRATILEEAVYRVASQQADSV